MLVLGRKQSEEILVDGIIKFKILHVGKTTIKVGVTAPENILIQRAELLNESKDKNSKDSIKAQAIKWGFL